MTRRHSPEKRDDLSPDGSPRRAVALVLRLHGDTDREVARRLLDLARGFDGDEHEARVNDGPHLSVGYDSAYTMRVERRQVTHAEWAVELDAWIEAHRSRAAVPATAEAAALLAFVRRVARTYARYGAFDIAAEARALLAPVQRVETGAAS